MAEEDSRVRHYWALLANPTRYDAIKRGEEMNGDCSACGQLGRIFTEVEKNGLEEFKVRPDISELLALSGLEPGDLYYGIARGAGGHP